MARVTVLLVFIVSRFSLAEFIFAKGDTAISRDIVGLMEFLLVPINTPYYIAPEFSAMKVRDNNYTRDFHFSTYLSITPESDISQLQLFTVLFKHKACFHYRK